ncbi:MAG: hypothetical protein JWP40_3789, partial [Blastococcus sp.]|nr:hypothetical protein [Blastococcus sp.]
PAAARGLVYAWVRDRATTESRTFAAGDEELTKVRDRAGMSSRGWTYKVLRELADAGVLEENDTGSASTFTIVSLDALGDLERGEAAA